MTVNSKRSAEADAREVISRMVALRREIATDVQHVGQSARAMSDWTFYVRRFPWATLALAAAAGYVLVPRKKRAVAPTPEQLADLASNKQFVAAATQHLKPADSVFRQVALAAGTMVGKAALSYFAAQLRASALAKRSHEPIQSAETQHETAR